MILKIQVSISGEPNTLIYDEKGYIMVQVGNRELGKKLLGKKLKGYFKLVKVKNQDW